MAKADSCKVLNPKLYEANEKLKPLQILAGRIGNRGGKPARYHPDRLPALFPLNFCGATPGLIEHSKTEAPFPTSSR